MWSSSIQNTVDVKSYFEVIKPKLVFLLVVTSLGAMVISASRNDIPLTLTATTTVVATAIAASAGCNVITSYVDRDIDALMTRTKDRPLPSRRINPPQKALYLGLILVLVSLVLAGLRNFLSFLCILLGTLDNVIVYSMMSKRRSPLNIILGGFSGGLAPLFGWVYIANSINLTAVLISSLVVLWIPGHIWALAIYYQSDYRKAGVPMLPVVIGTEKAIRCIVSTVVLLIFSSIALYVYGGFGPIYLSLSLVSGLLVFLGYLYLFFNPSQKLAWRMFKISSPHLFLLFIAMIIDSFVI